MMYELLIKNTLYKQPVIYAINLYKHNEATESAQELSPINNEILSVSVKDPQVLSYEL